MKKYNTDSVEPIKFMPHGSVECEILEEGILIYTASGPFNKELIQALVLQEGDAFSELELSWQHWAEVVVFRDSCMITEDAANEYKQFLGKMKTSGEAPVASAFVYGPDVEGTMIFSDVWKNINESESIPYHQFSHIDDALVWARLELSKRTQQD